jgi:outer membrane protein assembly factor BamB
VRSCVVLVTLAACGKQADPPAPAAAPTVTETFSCEPQPFAMTTPLAEASGAGWITFRGKPALFVLSDSGNDGAFAIVDPDGGDTIAQGSIGKSTHGDDYEGVTTRGGKLYAVISNGWYVRIDQDGEQFTATVPRALGEPAQLDGKNFEGICLDDSAQGSCIGFVASKGDGHLYCLDERDGALHADFARSIAITSRKRVADCAIDERGTLWVGANIHELNKLYRVDNWHEPAQARVVALDSVGVGNSEVLAVRGDTFYRMSDLDTAPSLMAKFRCKAASR